MEMHKEGYSMNIDELNKRKKEMCLSAKDIAKLSGLPLSTVQKVMGGVTKNPRRTTMLALEAVLGSGKSQPFRYETGPETTSVLRESGPDYVIKGIDGSDWDRQGSYTLEDYLSLPDEKRVEMIDGVFYDMSAPTYAHQIIAGEIYTKLRNYISNQKGTCMPFISPADIQLDCDDKTIVQPDVFVVCDRSKIRMARLFGNPDFVVEILSPSTRKKDMNIKTEKYRLAGVREYWIVDPDRRKIIVYLFGDDPDVFIYGFDDQVPVSIYDGKCLIDFKEISEEIAFLFE